MKTFSNLKRDLRTLYKPKTESKRLDEVQEPDGDVVEAPCDNSSIQLSSISSTAAHSDITQKPSSPENNGEPAEDIATHAQAPNDDHEHDISSNCLVSRDSGFAETANDSPITVETLRDNGNDHGYPIEEIREDDQGLESEDAEPLTFEKAQSLRDRVYTTFGAEEPEDFTDGPVRFVESADGVKNCVAILITYGLSQKIQTALQRQHEFSRIELEGIYQKQSLSRLRSAVHREIANCKARLCGLEDEGRMETEDARKLEQQLTILQLMLPDVEGRRNQVSMHVDAKAEQLRDQQAAVNAHLEAAFICARLIAPHEEEPEPEIEKLEISQEYLEFCQRLERADENIFEDAVMPLDDRRDHMEVPPPTEEEQARQDVINSLWAAKEALDLAHQNFDNREHDRAREYEVNVQASNRGEDTTDDSPEAFDVRWVIRFRDLTRALIEAEAVYADVKRKAFEAGVPLPFTDNESVFEGVGDETGYTMSKEQELVASAPSPTVRKWLSNMPEGGETGSVGEEAQLKADEWDAEEVGISDSVSLVAEGRQRSRIDRWQDACLAEKSQ
jgi:hypothetical protein